MAGELMAHKLTRLEGFELNTFLSLVGDTALNAVFQSTVKRSGDYACRISNDGVSAARIAMVVALNADGSTNGAVQNAVSYRAWIYMESYPSTDGLLIGQLEGAGGTSRSQIKMSTAGILTLDAVTGTRALPLLTWCELVGIYDSASTGSHSMMLDIDDDNGRVQEFTGVTPTANGTILRLSIGKSVGAGSYAFVVDDIAIESAAAVASIDYPAPGNVLGMDLDGNGAINGYSWAIAGSSPPATRWEAVNRPHDGNISHIGVSLAGVRKQTFTLEGSDVAGLGSIINGVMLVQTSRATGATTTKILMGSSNFDTVAAGAVTSVVTTGVTIGTSFNFTGSVFQTNPFTSAPWTTTDLDNLVIGIHAAPGAASIYRLSTASVMVDSQVEAGMTVNQTFLQQTQYPLGRIRSVTNYDPELHTVRITSEAYGVPNEVFNIIACSIRHVPSGVGVISGSWNFDQNATGSFVMANNPLRDAVMDGTTSPFLLDESVMVDGQQVYTEYVPIGDQGKIFEMSLTQAGSNCMEILAIDFELIPGGRQPAYLEGQF